MQRASVSTITAGTTTRFELRRAVPTDLEQRRDAREHDERRRRGSAGARTSRAASGTGAAAAAAPARRVPARAPREGYGCACGSASRGYASGCDRRGPRSRALADPDRRQPAQAGRPRSRPARRARPTSRRSPRSRPPAVGDDVLRGLLERRIADYAPRLEARATRLALGEQRSSTADRASGLARERVRLGGGARRLAGLERRRAHERGGHAGDVARVAERARDALGHGGARRDAARDDDRAASRRAPRSPRGRSPRARRRGTATSQARSQRGTSAGATAPAKRTASAMPSCARARLELGLQRPVADERERAAPHCARASGERLEQPREVLGGHEVADEQRRAARRSPSRARRPRPRASPSANASRSTPALTTCRRSPSGPATASRRAPSSSETANTAHALARRPERRRADARRALGVGDVGAVRGERVGHAGGARGAARDRPGRHEVVAPHDVGPAAARSRAGAPGEARVLAQRAPAAALLARGREHDLVARRARARRRGGRRRCRRTAAPAPGTRS